MHFAAMCERFPASFEGAELKSPHVGWNSLEEMRADSRLLRGVPEGGFVYYTHSWRAPVVEAYCCDDEVWRRVYRGG